MGSDESVGSCIPHLEFNNSQKQQLSDTKTTTSKEDHKPIVLNMERGTCFYCKKQGHWAVNCPDKQKNKPDSPGGGSRPVIIYDQSIPNRRCPCGGGPCTILTSHTAKNPGRKFYKCPRQMGMQCNFFQWCDMTTSDDFRDVLETPYPMCPCGAGMCHRYIERREGINKGRPYFVCPVKWGEGSCGFKMWQEIPTITSFGDHLSESKCAPRLTSDGQEKTKKIHEDKNGDGCKLNGITSPELSKKGLELPLINECHVKEETVRLDSTIHDKIISPITNLKLSDDKVNAQDSKAGQCSSESSYPMCPCGAGQCSRFTDISGRNYFICPVRKGEGACSFFQWEGQEDTKRKDEEQKHGDSDKFKGIVTPSSKKEGTDSNLTREYHVKEETVRFNSDTVRLNSDPVILNSKVSKPIINLMLNEDKTSVEVGKLGHCLWCGKEGHYLKDCITSNPHCFRCGKSGHWMKDCTA